MKKIKQGFVVESDWETALVWPVEGLSEEIKLIYGFNGKWNGQSQGEKHSKQEKTSTGALWWLVVKWQKGQCHWSTENEDLSRKS